MDLTEAPAEPGTNLPAQDLSTEILPVIYEIIRSIEKDHPDNTVKTRESQDCSLKVLELQKRLDQARAEIRQLPGIEYSKEQQLNNLESLKTQLKLKQELLQKYLANNEKLVHKLSESYPVQQAARLTVYLFNRGKSITDEHLTKESISKFRLVNFAKRFYQNVKEEMKQVKDKNK